MAWLDNQSSHPAKSAPTTWTAACRMAVTVTSPITCVDGDGSSRENKADSCLLRRPWGDWWEEGRWIALVWEIWSASGKLLTLPCSENECALFQFEFPISYSHTTAPHQVINSVVVAKWREKAQLHQIVENPEKKVKKSSRFRSQTHSPGQKTYNKFPVPKEWMMPTFLENLDKEASSFLGNCSWDTPK